MKYYLIAGEASGDLHASHLMHSLKQLDKDAEFRFLGGDLMAAEGGAPVKHYREMAYMGFVPVLLHLRTISRNMAECKKDIVRWQPDVLILIDYPGFNLSIAQYIKKNTNIPIYYYISPKIWAWKEYRIKNIRRDISELFSILPFEKDFFEGKHNYPIHYVGNPTMSEVKNFKASYNESFNDFTIRHGLDREKPIISLLAGSRRQEIKDNLPAMIAASEKYKEYQLVLAGAPGIEQDYYKKFIDGKNVRVVNNETFSLLYHSSAAIVTSGTATLETALFGVPQVVCYETPLPKFIAFCRRHLIKVPYISLVNLIAHREVVKELVADTFSVENISYELSCVLPGGDKRDEMLKGYADMAEALGSYNAPDRAAEIIIGLLSKK